MTDRITSVELKKSKSDPFEKRHIAGAEFLLLSAKYHSPLMKLIGTSAIIGSKSVTPMNIVRQIAILERF